MIATLDEYLSGVDAGERPAIRFALMQAIDAMTAAATTMLRDHPAHVAVSLEFLAAAGASIVGACQAYRHNEPCAECKAAACYNFGGYLTRAFDRALHDRLHNEERNGQQTH